MVHCWHFSPSGHCFAVCQSWDSIKNHRRFVYVSAFCWVLLLVTMGNRWENQTPVIWLMFGTHTYHSRKHKVTFRRYWHIFGYTKDCYRIIYISEIQETILNILFQHYVENQGCIRHTVHERWKGARPRKMRKRRKRSDVWVHSALFSIHCQISHQTVYLYLPWGGPTPWTGRKWGYK